MSEVDDPFRHAPGLRGLVGSPEASVFRHLQSAQIDEMAARIGLPPDWRYPDDVRDAMFRAALPGLGDGDIWVFAYGSLMWDPGIRFTEVRFARIVGLQRRFILVDRAGRGTPERPAVMAALDRGTSCDGLVFRIAAHEREAELELLWRRERIAPAYSETLLDVETALGKVRALTFVADHSTDVIRPDISRAEQVEAIATARGLLGTNFDYVANIKSHFDAIGIADAEIDSLHQDALNRMAELSGSIAKGQ